MTMFSRRFCKEFKLEQITSYSSFCAMKMHEIVRSSSNTSSKNNARKLPKPLRKANLVYQILMILLAGVNMFLMALNQSKTVHVSELYFEIFAALITIIPVLWSGILDKCKQFEADETPQSLSPVQSSPRLVDQKEDSVVQ